MTRPVRKEDENWAIKALLGKLNSNNTHDDWREDMAGPTDSPDLTLIGPKDRRVACEITQVGLQEWYRWQNDKNLELPDSELDEIVVPREVDIWLEKTLDKKNSKISEYLENSKAQEAWLILHGGEGKVHDLFCFDDEEYDLPLLVKAANETEHGFERIYALSKNADMIELVYPYSGEEMMSPDITLQHKLKMLKIRTMKSNRLEGGNIEFRIGSEFKPDRRRVLPLLDESRMKPGGNREQRRKSKKAKK